MSKPLHNINLSVAIDPVEEQVTFYANDLKSIALLRMNVRFYSWLGVRQKDENKIALAYVYAPQYLFDESVQRHEDLETMYRTGDRLADCIEDYGERNTNRVWVGFFRDNNIGFSITAFDPENELTRKAFISLYGNEKALDNLIEPDFEKMGKGFKRGIKAEFSANNKYRYFVNNDPADTKYFNDNFKYNKNGIFLKAQTGEVL